jgi:hypothetical protein
MMKGGNTRHMPGHLNRSIQLIGDGNRFTFLRCPVTASGNRDQENDPCKVIDSCVHHGSQKKTATNEHEY